MARLGVLTSEFERPSLDATLDAIVGHHIGAVQFQLGSAVPSVPLRAALQRGLDVLGAHLSPAFCAEIRGQLAERGLALAAVDGTFNMSIPTRSAAGRTSATCNSWWRTATCWARPWSPCARAAATRSCGGATRATTARKPWRIWSR